MHNHTAKRTTSRLAAVAAAACMVCLLFAGCAMPNANQSTDENASANRQYMAQLNQKTEQLNEVLGQFQDAVAEQDAVGMKAAADSATRIVEQVKATEATEALEGVKEVYVSGLEELNAALDSYADLYSQVAAGSLTGDAFERQLKSVQADYDHAIDRISAADEELAKLANE